MENQWHNKPVDIQSVFKKIYYSPETFKKLLK